MEKSKFIALFSRYSQLDYLEFTSMEEAVSFLEGAADEGQCMPIAVISEKMKMIWYDVFLGKDECQKRVNEFLENLSQ